MALDIKSKPQFAGAYNLLANCGEAQSGERLLLCYEPSNLGYYDQKIIDDVHNCALEMGLAVTLCELGFDPYVAQLPAGLDQAMDSADLTVFLARTADQMRFFNFKVGQRYIISYALTGASLASAFGAVNYEATQRLKSVVDQAIFSAEKIDISCPAGTAFSGVINQASEGQ
jgi:hypothetical protein